MNGTPPGPRLRVVQPAASPTTPRPAPSPRTAWTAAELMAMQFPEPRWAVPGLLAEGVSLLAGPPKVGKSWLSLSLGLTIAAGGRAFGRIDVEPGPVLYLALEDTARRLRGRMGKLLAGEPAPDRLTLVTACPPLPQGGDDAIAAWLDRSDGDARVIGIPAAGRVRVGFGRGCMTGGRPGCGICRRPVGR